MKTPFFCCLAVILCAYPILAGAGELMAYSDLDVSKRSHKCFTAGQQVDVHFFYVPSVADPFPDSIQGIRFRVPTPPCMTAAVRIDIAPPGLVILGDSMNEVIVGFGGCVSVPVHVLTVRMLIVSVNQNCCPFQPQDVVVTDCGGTDHAGVTALAGFFGNTPCLYTIPNSPAPADGATISTPSTTLQWQATWDIPICDLGDAPMHNLYFGTNPADLDKFWDTGGVWPVENLAPGVTYYWRGELSTFNGAGPYQGPLWSFTVQSPLDATVSTWGRIKALYQ